MVLGTLTIDADDSTFAIITSRLGGTVTILNMDNPEMPVQIHGHKRWCQCIIIYATGIEIVQINTRTYALVASNLDNAMQIIDITHPNYHSRSQLYKRAALNTLD